VDVGCGKWQNRRVIAQAVEQDLSSDAGLLLFGLFDGKLGWTKQFSSLIVDTRSEPDHSILSIVQQRVFGIVAGYEDQNDHDTLRSDPVFKMLAGRTPAGKDLASQPTISRLENAVKPSDLLNLEQWFLDKFVESFKSDPALITLDIDTYADAAHGEQQLTFWHDYYKQNQYQVRLVTCAESDMIVFPVLLFGSASVKLGAADDLQRIIEAIRGRFPEVAIHVRADSGFAGPDVYQMLESFEHVSYTIGMAINPKTKRLSENLLQETIAAQEKNGDDQLRYMSIVGYRSVNWGEAKRNLVIKCEATAHSTSRRVLISNRAEVVDNPEVVYREYAERGESENRNKELKCGLSGDRLSDHRVMANIFRLMMHCLSHNLLITLRQLVAVPAPQGQEETESLPTPANRTFKETKAERKVHNDRRKRDPLGEGHPCTWRTHLIKVAARIVVSARRVVLQMSASWPHMRYFERVAVAIDLYRPHTQ
jgi:hypothetical protein